MARGRKHKEVFASDDDRLEDLLFKLYDFEFDGEKWMAYRTNYTLGFDDLAFIMWVYDGKKTPKPLTKMGMLVQVGKIVQKIHKKLKEAKWTDAQLRDLLQMLSGSGRHSAACCDKVESLDYSYSD